MTTSPDNMDVDAFVGMKVRVRRREIGMAQSRLGALLGVTFQQVQKYERGTNRISASKLFMIAQYLAVPVSYFFEDCEKASSVSCTAKTADDDLKTKMLPYLVERDVVRLLGYFSHITDEKRRRRVLSLVNSIAGG